MATEPAAMKELVDGCRKVYRALGSYERKLTLDEVEQRKKMRRSIVAAVDMPEGHRIGTGDLTAKRPGDGIPVDAYENIVGQVLTQDIKKDQLILDEYLCERESE